MEKKIIEEIGGNFDIDVNILYEKLLELPAEKYLKLYHKMQEKILGYPPLYCGCNPIIEEEK